VPLYLRKCSSKWAKDLMTKSRKHWELPLGNSTNAFDGTNLLVCEKRCAQCLFSKAKIVNDERQAAMLTKCRVTGRYFICHKSAGGKPVICRGFFDEVPNQAIRAARLLNVVRFVNPKGSDAAKEDE